MIIMFVGLPGSGKGTLSTLLKEKYNFVHLSTGNMLREEINAGGSLGLKIKEVIDGGNFVDDELMKELLLNVLKRLNEEDDIILDGYPRNSSQIKDLNEILTELNRKIDFVFNLEVDRETAENRNVGRMNCPLCKRDYNSLSGNNTPKIKDLCDECGVKLTKRADDTKEIYQVRYRKYLRETEHVVKYYWESGVLISVDGMKKPDEVLNEIEQYILESDVKLIKR